MLFHKAVFRSSGLFVFGLYYAEYICSVQRIVAYYVYRYVRNEAGASAKPLDFTFAKNILRFKSCIVI